MRVQTNRPIPGGRNRLFLQSSRRRRIRVCSSDMKIALREGNLDACILQFLDDRETQIAGNPPASPTLQPGR